MHYSAEEIIQLTLYLIYRITNTYEILITNEKAFIKKVPYYLLFIHFEAIHWTFLSFHFHTCRVGMVKLEAVSRVLVHGLCVPVILGWRLESKWIFDLKGREDRPKVKKWTKDLILSGNSSLNDSDSVGWEVIQGIQGPWSFLICSHFEKHRVKGRWIPGTTL